MTKRQRLAAEIARKTLACIMSAVLVVAYAPNIGGAVAAAIGGHNEFAAQATVQEGDVVEIDGYGYETFAAAAAKAEKGNVLTLIKDFETTDTEPTAELAKSIAIDLNGHHATSLSEKPMFTIKNSASVTVMDSSHDANGVLEATHIFSIDDGTLILEAGMLEGGDGAISDTSEGPASICITGGTIRASNAVFLGSANGSFTMTGGTIDAQYNAFAISSQTASITGGIIGGSVTSENATHFISGGTFNEPLAEELIAEGYFQNTDHAVIDNCDATLTDKNGEVTKYETAAAALAAADDGSTVTMLRLSEAKKTIVIDKEITLDLGSATLRNDADEFGTGLGDHALIRIAQGGKLTVKGTTGSILTDNVNAIHVEGELVLEGGTVEAFTHTLNVANGGTAVIAGGTVAATQEAASVTGAQSTLKVESGAIEAEEDAAKVYGGTFEMTGGKITTDKDFAVYVVGSEGTNASAAIAGGVIEGPKGIHVYEGTSATVSGGTITADGTCIDNDGTLAISGGTLTGAIESTQAKFVTGGTFDSQLNAAFIADGYFQDADNTVKEDSLIVTLSQTETTYNGQAQVPTVTAKYVSGADVTNDVEVTWDPADPNFTDAGTYTATVTHEGKSAQATYTIRPVDISGFKLQAQSSTFTGFPVTPSFKVYDKSGALFTDYEVTSISEDLTHAGRKNITVEGTGNYCGTLTGRFTIYTADFNDVEFTLETEKVITDGSEKYEPAVTGVLKSTSATGEERAYTLEQGVDYSVTYANNTQVGTATAIIKNINPTDFAGSTVEKPFIIELPYVAQIGQTRYLTVAEAVDAAANGDTVTLLADATGNFKTNKQNLTLDLNGKTFTVDVLGGITVETGGSLTIANGAITSQKPDIITAYGGTITLLGTEEKPLNVTCEVTAIHARLGGTVNVDGAFVSSAKEMTADADGTDARGVPSTVNVHAGSITNISSNALLAKNGAVATVSGGTVYTEGDNANPAARASYKGKVIITGEGVASSETGYAIIAEDNGIVEVNGGTVTGAGGILVYKTASSAAGIGGGTLIVNGGTVTGTSTYGVLSKLGSATVAGGTVSGAVQALATEGDGTINITGGAFSDNLANSCAGCTRPEGEYLVKREDGMYVLSTIETRNTTTGEYYATLAAAVEDAENGETLQLSADTITLDEAVAFSGKAITIDLAGKDVQTSSSQDPLFDVSYEGGLTIVDSSDKESWGSLNAKTIVKLNYASFTLESGTLSTMGGNVIESYNSDVTISDGIVSPIGGIGVLQTGTLGTLAIAGGEFQCAAASLPLFLASACVQASGGTVSISGGKFTYSQQSHEEAFALPEGSLTVSGGWYSTAVPEDGCDEGYVPVYDPDPQTGMYTVEAGIFVARNITAQKGYTTLQKAINAAGEGDKITLLKNIELDETLNIEGKKITLNLGSFGIANAGSFETSASTPLIHVRSAKGSDAYTPADLTLTGASEAYIATTGTHAIYVAGSTSSTATNRASLALEKVSVSAEATAILVSSQSASAQIGEDAAIMANTGDTILNKGTLTIKAGSVTNTKGTAIRTNFIRACTCINGGTIYAGNKTLAYDNDAYREMQVNGGMFSDSAGNDAAFTRADGKMLIRGANTEYPEWYVLGNAVALNMQTEEYYGALEQAIAEVTNDGTQTVMLLDDVMLADKAILPITGNFTLDLCGKTITGSNSWSVITIGDDNPATKGSLTIDDSSTQGTGKIVNGANTSKCFVVKPGASLTVKKGNIYTQSGTAIESHGTTVLDGGSIEGPFGVRVLTGGTLTVNEGAAVTGNTRGIEIPAGTNQNVSINGGTIVTKAPADYSAPLFMQSGTATISGGIFKGYNCVCMHSPLASGTPVSSPQAPAVTITGGIFTATSDSVFVDPRIVDHSFTIEGGYFSDAKGNGTSYTRPAGKYLMVMHSGDYAGMYELDTAVAHHADVYYRTLQEAVDAAGTKQGAKVNLMADSAKGAVVAEGQDIELDLAGNSISVEEAYAFGGMQIGDALVNKGTLTVIDSGRDTDEDGTVDTFGTVSTYSSASAAIANIPAAKAMLKGGTYQSNIWYVIKNLGEMEISGNVNVSKPEGSTDTASLIDNGWYGSTDTVAGEKYTATTSSKASMLINGEFAGKSGSKSCAVLKNDYCSELTVLDGTFDSTNNAGKENAGTLLNFGHATISGGYFIGLYPITNGGYGTEGVPCDLTIEGGMFVSTDSGKLLIGTSPGTGSNGTISIRGGYFDGGIKSSTNSQVTISGGYYTQMPSMTSTTRISLAEGFVIGDSGSTSSHYQYAAIETPKPVFANLHDCSGTFEDSELITNGRIAVTQTYTSAITVRYYGTLLRRHENPAGTAAFWLGVGIPQLDFVGKSLNATSVSYTTGTGSYNPLKAEPITPDSVQTEGAVAYDTFYFGSEQSIAENRYVAATYAVSSSQNKYGEPSESSYTVIYSLNFTNVKPATASITKEGVTTLYGDIPSAIKAATDNDTIVMMRDVALTSSVTLKDKSIVLDPAGYTISKGTTTLAGAVINVNSTDTAKQTRLMLIGAGTIRTPSKYAIALKGAAELEVNGNNVTVEAGGAAVHEGENAIAIYVGEGATATVASGKVNSTAGPSIFNCGTLNINGGTITSSEGSGVKTDGTNAHTLISGGVIDTFGDTLVYGEYAEMKIDGGVFSDTAGNADAFTRPANSYLTKGADENYPDHYALETSTAYNVTTNEYYPTLQAAIDTAAPDGTGVVQPLGDINYGGGNLSVFTHVTLDLNGKTISSTGDPTINVARFTNDIAGKLTIIDSSSDSSGKVINKGSSFYTAIRTATGTELTVKGGTITAGGIGIDSSGTTTVSGGTVGGGMIGMRVSSGAATVASDANINGGSYGVETQNNSNVTVRIEGGNITTTNTASNEYAALFMLGGTANVSGGKLVGGSGIYLDVLDNEASNQPSVTVEDGIIEGAQKSIGIDSDLSTYAFNINGGSFSDGEGNGAAYTRPANHLLVSEGAYYVLKAMRAKSGDAYYQTLQEAVDAAGTDATEIVLLADSSTGVAVDAGQDITVDLAGNNIRVTEAYAASGKSIGDAFANKGALVVKDSGRDADGDGETDTYGTVFTSVAGSAAIANVVGATAALQGGTYQSDAWYVVKNLGTMEISGATTVSKPEGCTSTASLIDNGWYGSTDLVAGEKYTAAGSQATLTITGGEFLGKSGAKSCSVLKNDDFGAIDVSGGRFDSTNNTSGSNAATLLNYGTGTISGGYFIGSYPITNGGYGTTADPCDLSINGGTFVSTGSFLNGYAGGGNKGKIAITDGTFEGTFYKDSSNTMTITGGLFSDASGNTACAVPSGMLLQKIADGENAGKYMLAYTFEAFDVTTPDATYTGQAQGAQPVFTPKAASGEPATVEAGDYTLAYTDAQGNELLGTPTDSGTYTVVATATPESKYAGSTTAAFTYKINKCDVTLAIGTIGAVTYNGQAQEPPLEVTATNADGVAVDNATYDAVWTDNTDAGEATVNLTPSGEFTGEAATATFTINPAEVTIAANDAQKTVGDEDPEFTATVTGLIGTDTADYELERETGEDVGTYAISVQSASVPEKNYTLNTANGTFTILEAPKGDLEGSLGAAEEAADAAIASADGSGLSAGTTYVAPEAVAALRSAVAKARAVASNRAATQAEVDKAMQELQAAIQAFNDAKKTVPAAPEPTPTPTPTPAPTPAPATTSAVEEPVEDNAPVETAGPGASETQMETFLSSLESDDDPEGAVFHELRLLSKKTTKNAVSLSWTKVSGVSYYNVYGAKCGKANKYEKVDTVAGSKKSYTVKDIAGQKIAKKTSYKFILIAFDSDGKSISTSRPIHVVTTGGKQGIYKSVKPSKKKVTIKRGKSAKLKAKLVKKSSKLKPINHRKLRFESENESVATVNAKNGKAKGVSKGKVKIYAYAENGVYGVITVTVK